MSPAKGGGYFLQGRCNMDMFDQQFKEELEKEAPLATRMRPMALHEFVGQEHIIGKGRVLRKAIETGQIPSVILWGPPGSGKTTLAHLIANSTDYKFHQVSAVSAGVNDLRRIIEEAKEYRKLYRKKSILFIDEIHRFNKAQQDSILPYVEDGTITLIGATTENPSFEVISPLISGSRVLHLNPLTDSEIRVLIVRALKDTLRGLGSADVELDEKALFHLIKVSRTASAASRCLPSRMPHSTAHCSTIREGTTTLTLSPPCTSQ